MSEGHGPLDPKKEFYSLFRPGNLFLWQQRERALVRALRWAGVDRATIERLRILEVGCGAGGLLPQLVSYGATPRLLVGLDRDRARVREASSRHPGIHFIVGDATQLPIESGRFGYRGTLTLFDPPARLDRIELSQVTDSKSAMGRWVARRGDSLYMAYVETHDLEDVIARLDSAGARWTPRGQTREGERHGLWVHPSALHGLLLGVSRTTLAWEWSGRPELVTPLTTSS